MKKLTALIPCLNSEKTIAKTLESVKWADEIIVVDSGSTDETLAVCRRYTDRIFSHEYLNSAKQKNWAIPQCSGEWILQIDSDEALEPGFAGEIQTALKEAPQNIDAFKMCRKNFAYGQWLHYGAFYPDYQVRLFRKGKGLFQDKEVHAKIVVPGEVGTLKGNLLHDDFKNLSWYLTKFERYMRYECDQLVKEGKRFSIARVTVYPFALFLRDYFLKQGFRDGWLGLLMAALNSFYYFMKYAKLWEYEWKQKKTK